MKYTSTRGDVMVDETYALLHGLAEDGGLYVPSTFPSNSLTYEMIANKSYQEIAVIVLEKLFTSFSQKALREMVQLAYSEINFDTSDIAPLHSLSEHVSILELFHGRTQAFKDMALSLFPYLLVAAKKIEKESKNILILTATSGDTGKAALEGFKDVEETHIQIFYPTDGVSPMQKEQMQKQEGSNVNVTAINGNFDDAQQFLKRLFVDETMADTVAQKDVMFSSANSINIGRLAPQIIYYVFTYAELVSTGAIHTDETFNVVVPTGNFGNILAAYYAKKMGIPIGKLICASNQNNVLTDFFNTGTYDMNRPFYTTISPSMDILESSNFERFLYYISGEDSERTSFWMETLKKTGSVSVNEDELKRIQHDFSGAYIDDEETKSIIDEVYNSYGYLLDPHTAVAMGAYMKELQLHPELEQQHTVIAATAHPFKFPAPICEALHIQQGHNAYESLEAISAVTGVAFPKQLLELRNKKLRFTKTIDKEAMKEEILLFVDSFVK
ncbi:threonine synthase [Veillonella montpellierensis]|uniref:threonine synthase n=1 Tax=Veillonella montpellierensis TaxID=187328 RepID=UPI00040BE391|nr:threonine synthase [Veillonella montpellierensis]